MATTIDVYGPFDAGAGANWYEDSWRNMARFWARSGVVPGELNEIQVYADSSGMQVKVKTGACYVGGHYGSIASEKTLPIAAYTGTNRNDLVVLRADYTNNRIELDVLQGASLTVPSVTQNSSLFEIPLAVVLVDTNTSIAAGKVTDARQFSTANGGIGQTATGAPSADSLGAPYVGMRYQDRTTGIEAVYDGTVWRPVGSTGARTAWTPTWSGSASITRGNGTLTGAYRILSRELFGDVHIVIGSTTNLNSANNWTFSLPSGVTFSSYSEEHVGTGHVFDTSAGKRYPLLVFKASTSTINAVPADPAGVTTKLGYNVPVALATGDEIHLRINAGELA